MQAHPSFCMGPPRRPKPSGGDPLEQPTPNLRLQAAYTQAGHSRSSFRKELGKAYTTVDAWDSGTVEIGKVDVATFARACEIAGRTMDEIWSGRPSAEPRAPSARGGQPQHDSEAFHATASQVVLQVIRAANPAATTAEIDQLVAVALAFLRAGSPPEEAATRTGTYLRGIRASDPPKAPPETGPRMKISR